MKKIFILSLLIFSSFLFFGCTEPENNINQTNITNENSTTLYVFYDPTWNLTIYDSVLFNLEEKLPGLIIEKKCIDIQKYSSNTSSASENLCTDEIGFLKYSENMKLLEEIKISTSNLVLKVKNQTVEVPFTPVSTAFAKTICLEDETINGCSVLEELKPINTTIITNISLTEDYSTVLSVFESAGIPLQTDNKIDYSSDEAKAIYTLKDISSVPVLLINTEDYGGASEEQKILLDQYILMGYFKEINGTLILSLPGSEIYVGPKYNESNIELFIMSYCPYGLQSQKAIIPVKEAFGDELNLTIKFVNYVMHGVKEIDENNLQYCIQKNNEDIFFEYLDCFTIGGNSTECLTQVNLTKEETQPCVDELDSTYKIMELHNDTSTWLNGRYPQYPVQKEENELYGVKGSPTLVFNGKQMSWPRSPEGIKQGICNLLENPPEVCNTELDSASASPGFGGTTTTTTTTGSCG